MYPHLNIYNYKTDRIQQYITFTISKLLPHMNLNHTCKSSPPPLQFASDATETVSRLRGLDTAKISDLCIS